MASGGVASARMVGVPGPEDILIYDPGMEMQNNFNLHNNKS